MPLWEVVKWRVRRAIRQILLCSLLSAFAALPFLAHELSVKADWERLELGRAFVSEWEAIPVALGLGLLIGPLVWSFFKFCGFVIGPDGMDRIRSIFRKPTE